MSRERRKPRSIRNDDDSDAATDTFQYLQISIYFDTGKVDVDGFAGSERYESHFKKGGRNEARAFIRSVSTKVIEGLGADVWSIDLGVDSSVKPKKILPNQEDDDDSAGDT
jgi:hypothetical protein